MSKDPNNLWTTRQLCSTTSEAVITNIRPLQEHQIPPRGISHCASPISAFSMKTSRRHQLQGFHRVFSLFQILKKTVQHVESGASGVRLPSSGFRPAKKSPHHSRVARFLKFTFTPSSLLPLPPQSPAGVHRARRGGLGPGHAALGGRRPRALAVSHIRGYGSRLSPWPEEQGSIFSGLDLGWASGFLRTCVVGFD